MKTINYSATGVLMALKGCDAVYCHDNNAIFEKTGNIVICQWNGGSATTTDLSVKGINQVLDNASEDSWQSIVLNQQSQ